MLYQFYIQSFTFIIILFKFTKIVYRKFRSTSQKKGTEQNGKSKVPNNEAKKPRLPLITGAPPPPLEQYVYSEGYPHSPLRPGGNKKANDTVAVVVGDEILNGAMIAKKIGVDRPSSPEPNIGRDENGEKLAMDRLK